MLTLISSPEHPEFSRLWSEEIPSSLEVLKRQVRSLNLRVLEGFLQTLEKAPVEPYEKASRSYT